MPDLAQARFAIQQSMVEIRSPYNDGWTSSACKYDLYVLKSWLDEQYARLPHFTGEEQWEQQRIIDLLQRPER
jgi:hypothetical protein